ncbi:MAG: YCF48-related protein [Bacteroidota bacterium]|nr:YCF48-related protein [Bacteroidota bacterium]
METSYQKLIHDYLDGTLSEEEERSLFDNLSAHPEWREELAFQMRMHEAMQKDIASVSIPAKTTASVFAALGFGVPQKASAAFFAKALPRLGLSKAIIGISSLAVAAVSVYVIAPKTADSPKQIAATTVRTPVVPAAENISPTQSPNIATLPAAEREAAHPAPELHRSYQDIGKFSSVDYLTKSKVIGITSGGNIFISDDGGSLWSEARSNTSKDLYGVHFSDSSNGVIVGAAGTILLTANSGKDWASVSSGTEANLIAVRYITRDTLFACGAQGTILRSTSGGLIWKKLESGTAASLFKIRFQNGREGTIGGEHGITLQTHDGGSSWSPLP